MARTYAQQRAIYKRIKASPEHRAYEWALHRCVELEDSITCTSRETEDDWWALLRVLWKAKLGRDPSQPCQIGNSWVEV